MEALDLLANNLANGSTQGYKADREIYNLYVGADAGAGDSGNVALSPLIEGSWIDFAQGTLQSTGNPLNVALSGRGFFVAKAKDGPVYTRNGSLQVSGDGTLLAPEGYPLLDAAGRTVKINPERSFDVSRDGSVVQEGETVGKLAVVQFANSAALSKRGSSYFVNANRTEKPAPAPGVEIHQGKVESSNVSSAEAAVRLVTVMRHFEMLQKAIAQAGDMGRRAIQEVAKVGP